MSSSAGKEQLVATAIAAAAAGAAIAYAAVKSQENKSDAPRLTKKKSAIFDDGVDPRAKGDILFPHNHEEKMRRRIAQRVVVEEENKRPRTSVTVRVPATSANVGPGCEYKYLLTKVKYQKSIHCIFKNTNFSLLVSER